MDEMKQYPIPSPYRAQFGSEYALLADIYALANDETGLGNWARAFLDREALRIGQVLVAAACDPDWEYYGILDPEVPDLAIALIATSGDSFSRWTEDKTWEDVPVESLPEGFKCFPVLEEQLLAEMIAALPANPILFRVTQPKAIYKSTQESVVAAANTAASDIIPGMYVIVDQYNTNAVLALVKVVDDPDYGVRIYERHQRMWQYSKQYTNALHSLNPPVFRPIKESDLAQVQKHVDAYDRRKYYFLPSDTPTPSPSTVTSAATYTPFDSSKHARDAHGRFSSSDSSGDGASYGDMTGDQLAEFVANGTMPSDPELKKSLDDAGSSDGKKGKGKGKGGGGSSDKSGKSSADKQSSQQRKAEVQAAKDKLHQQVLAYREQAKQKAEAQRTAKQQLAMDWANAQAADTQATIDALAAQKQEQTRRDNVDKQIRALVDSGVPANYDKAAQMAKTEQQQRMQYDQNQRQKNISDRMQRLKVRQDLAKRKAALYASAEPLVAVTINPPSHSMMPERLKLYWTRGKGAAKIKWGIHGDFNRCRKHLIKYVNPAQIDGLCANLHRLAIGVWPGREP